MSKYDISLIYTMLISTNCNSNLILLIISNLNFSQDNNQYKDMFEGTGLRIDPLKQQSYFLQLNPINLFLKSDTIPKPPNTFKFVIFKDEQIFDQNKMATQANFILSQNGYIMNFIKSGVNFYIPNFNKTRIAIFTLKLFMTQKGQQYDMQANLQIDPTKYIQGFNEQKKNRFEERSTLSKQFDLEYEMYIERSRFQLQKIAKQCRIQRCMKSSGKQSSLANSQVSNEHKNQFKDKNYTPKKNANNTPKRNYVDTPIVSNFAQNQQKDQKNVTQNKINANYSKIDANIPKKNSTGPYIRSPKQQQANNIKHSLSYDYNDSNEKKNIIREKNSKNLEKIQNEIDKMPRKAETATKTQKMQQKMPQKAFHKTDQKPIQPIKHQVSLKPQKKVTLKAQKIQTTSQNTSQKTQEKQTQKAKTIQKTKRKQSQKISSMKQSTKLNKNINSQLRTNTASRKMTQSTRIIPSEIQQQLAKNSKQNNMSQITKIAKIVVSSVFALYIIYLVMTPSRKI